MALLTLKRHHPEHPYSLVRAGLFFFFLIPVISFSQTTNISGIINTYYSVTEVVYSEACVRVDNTSGLSSGDKVLIIQMKGAAINTANSSSFGDTTSLNDAGNYEVGTICSIGGDSVFLFHTLLNQYTISGKVQLVKFGEYISANVVDTVKALSWNQNTGKGGVIAISVDQDLTLNAPVYADSSGYAGGAFIQSNSTCNSFTSGYVYNGSFSSPQSGAMKGEGAADVAVAQSGGRGAPANGGGGGNNHNNGGGGGANLTYGGAGGGNYTTVSGACTGNFKGLGGKALSSYSGTKIFLGGGGGAGHVNNNIPTHGGGSGGGIVFIIAQNVIGNGYKISANGRVGGNGGSDGASGGGAGGTVIMHVYNSYPGTLTIEAKGGNGGTANNQNITDRCYGAGGGGSGGVIYFNSAIPAITTSVAGGNAGPDVGVIGCGTPVPATTGTAGLIIPGYTYRSSSDVSNSCGSALPVSLLSFTTNFINKIVVASWKVSASSDISLFSVEKKTANGSWRPIALIHGVNGQSGYSAADQENLAGVILYRLKITDRNNKVSYSAIRKMVFGAPLSVFPNPAAQLVTVTGNFIAGDQITISDVTGRLIRKKILTDPVNSCSFPVSGINKGVYILQSGSQYVKLVIR